MPITPKALHVIDMRSSTPVEGRGGAVLWEVEVFVEGSSGDTGERREAAGSDSVLGGEGSCVVNNPAASRRDWRGSSRHSSRDVIEKSRVLTPGR